MNAAVLFRIVIVAIVIYLIADAIAVTRRFFRQQFAFNQLKQICSALHQYHEEWGALPTPEWQNDEGTNLSFRVLMMSYFESSEAKRVAIESKTTKSVAELEASGAFQKWRDSGEGQLFLSRSVEFLQVTGPWPTWGRPLSGTKGNHWNGESVPLVVAADVIGKSKWCQPSLPATISTDHFVVGPGYRSRDCRYANAGCTILNASVIVDEKK